MSIRLASFFVAAATLAACSAGTPDTSESTQTRLSTSPGLVLRGAGADSDLSLSFSMSLDTQDVLPSMLRPVQVVRGTVGFEAYCSVSAHLDQAAQRYDLDCQKYAGAHFDSDSLKFHVAERGGVFTLEKVTLQGPNLDAEHAALVGGHGSAPFGLSIALSMREPSANPLLDAHEAADALAPLLGRPTYVQPLDVMKPAIGFDVTIDEYMIAHAMVVFAEKTPDVEVSFALVQKAYDASTPWLSPQDLAARAADMLPRAPLCDDGGHPITSAEAGAALALTPLGGPSYHLATPVSLDAVPAAVAAGLRDAAAEIRGRSVDGYDTYSADVNDSYAIASSCGDGTPAFYGVWGSGSAYDDPHDEFPIYEDGIVIIVGPDGTRLYEASDVER